MTQTYTNDNYTAHHKNVEVRRGSHIPPDENEIHKVHEVKKKYIMKEDGTVVLVGEEEHDIQG